MTRLLVCGDRQWGGRKRRTEDVELLIETLLDVRRLYGADVVIEGCARGADRMAGGPCPSAPWDEHRGWAKVLGIPVEHFPANWKTHIECYCPPGRGYCGFAGLRRNEQMLLQGKPDIVVAFHRSFNQSKGTLHMVTIARKAGVPTFVFPSSH